MRMRMLHKQKGIIAFHQIQLFIFKRRSSKRKTHACKSLFLKKNRSNVTVIVIQILENHHHYQTIAIELYLHV